MGVRVFRDDNWDRLKAGNISDRDIMVLDDRECNKFLQRYDQKERAICQRGVGVDGTVTNS